MKIVETKIFLKFILWFVVVSILPIVALFIIIYFFNPDSIVSASYEFKRAVLFSLFVTLALVLALSTIATKRLSRVIVKPIQVSVEELSKVVDDLFGSIQNLSEISQNNSELSGSLLKSSKDQRLGLKSGVKAASGIYNSLNKIAKKTETSARNSRQIDNLAVEGGEKSNKALDSLVLVKHLATENQKLSHALDNYTEKVTEVAKKVSVLSETAKFLSLNVSIEANKTSFSEDFSALVSQIRGLNIASEEAAKSIETLSQDMSRQITQYRESSVYESEETDKIIQVLGETISFLNKIVSNASKVSKNIQVIDKETRQTREEADDINSMIKNLSKEAKRLVQHTDNISQIIAKELTVTRSLNKSSVALNKVTETLNNLVGKI